MKSLISQTLMCMLMLLTTNSAGIEDKSSPKVITFQSNPKKSNQTTPGSKTITMTVTAIVTVIAGAQGKMTTLPVAVMEPSSTPSSQQSDKTGQQRSSSDNQGKSTSNNMNSNSHGGESSFRKQSADANQSGDNGSQETTGSSGSSRSSNESNNDNSQINSVTSDSPISESIKAEKGSAESKAETSKAVATGKSDDYGGSQLSSMTSKGAQPTPKSVKDSGIAGTSEKLGQTRTSQAFSTKSSQETHNSAKESATANASQGPRETRSFMGAVATSVAGKKETPTATDVEGFQKGTMTNSLGQPKETPTNNLQGRPPMPRETPPRKNQDSPPTLNDKPPIDTPPNSKKVTSPGMPPPKGSTPPPTGGSSPPPSGSPPSGSAPAPKGSNPPTDGTAPPPPSTAKKTTSSSGAATKKSPAPPAVKSGNSGGHSMSPLIFDTNHDGHVTIRKGLGIALDEKNKDVKHGAAMAGDQMLAMSTHFSADGKVDGTTVFGDQTYDPFVTPRKKLDAPNGFDALQIISVSAQKLYPDLRLFAALDKGDRSAKFVNMTALREAFQRKGGDLGLVSGHEDKKLEPLGDIHFVDMRYKTDNSDLKKGVEFKQKSWYLDANMKQWLVIDVWFPVDPFAPA